MRFLQILLIILCLLLSATLSAQVTYQYGEGTEILLDDFPVSTEGFRIQLGAFSSESSALAFKDSLQRLVPERMHLHYADKLWRVRVGDFADSSAAANYLSEVLSVLDLPAGIVVTDKVISPSPVVWQRVKIPGFRIQINALSDRDQALELGRKLDYNNPEFRAYVIHQNGLYRVQFGDFRNRKECEVWLPRLKETYSSEVWIVSTLVYENPPPSPLEHPAIDQFEYDD